MFRVWRGKREKLTKINSEKDINSAPKKLANVWDR